MHEKVDIKSVLMYMEPKGMMSEDDFAQCRSCMMWGKQDHICMGHGLNDVIIGDGTCGGYAEGEPHGDKKMLEKMLRGKMRKGKRSPDSPGSWTKKESGYEVREVRCENCYYADNKATLCKLIEKKLADESDTYKGDAKIIPKGCCNANHKKERGKPSEKEDGPSEGLKRMTIIKILQEA